MKIKYKSNLEIKRVFYVKHVSQWVFSRKYKANKLFISKVECK